MGIVAVLLAVVALGGIGYLVYRQRRSANMDLPPPDIGELVDYTSEPLEEPQTWQDRLKQLSLPGRILLLAVPVVLVLACIAIGLFALPANEPANVPPTPVPELTITEAVLINARTINVIAETTNVANGSEVRFELREEDGDVFPWYLNSEAMGEVESGRITMRVGRDPGGPMGEEGETYRVVLSVDTGLQVLEQERELQVPDLFRNDFYGAPPTPTPTTAPTAGPTITPTATVPPTAAPAEPTPTTPAGIQVVVGNGGNVRAEPTVGSPVVGQITLGETVQVFAKTPDEAWFQVQTTDNVVGWTSVLALGPDAAIIPQIPLEGAQAPAPAPAPEAPPDDAPPVPEAPPDDAISLTDFTAVVFNGGRLRQAPDFNAALAGQDINAGETVELLARTSDGVWYKVRTIREETGWTHNTLLTIPPDIATQVPVE